MEGSIEVLETGLCSNGLTHANSTTGTAVAFRFANPGGKFEMPELPSVGTVTVHVKNGNPSNDCNLVLEKYNPQTDTCEVIDSYLLRMRNNLKNDNGDPLLDEALSIDVNSATPLKVRLHNYKIGTLGVRYINMYHVDVTGYIDNGVQELSIKGLKQLNRQIIVDQPTQVALYNVLGNLLLNEFVTGEITIPTVFGKGVFMLQTNRGNQKIVLK